MAEKLWDSFLCHATEDKLGFVDPLAEELRLFGLEVWYDKFVLKVGDSLRRKVDEGLSKSRFGVVILSHAFFAKNWGREELDGLFTLQMEGQSRILPVWHGVTKAEVIGHSPILAGHYALNSADGVKAVARGLVEVIRPDCLKFETTHRNAKAAVDRIAEQIAEIHPGLDTEVVLRATTKNQLDEISAAAKPGVVASILRDGLQINLIARDPSEYHRNPITGRVTVKREGAEKILAAQRTGRSVVLKDELSDFSVEFFSQLFPGVKPTGELTIQPVAARHARKLNWRVSFTAGEQLVTYDRIEFTVERLGTEEVELVSTAPPLPIEVRLVLQFLDHGARFNVKTHYSEHDIREILKADLAVSILSSGGRIELFNLDSGRGIGSLEHTPSKVSEEGAALSRFIQAAHDVAVAFDQPLRWVGRLDENECFKAVCLAEIVRKGVLELPVKPMPMKMTAQEMKQLEACIAENRAVRFERARFYEADGIFGTHFEAGPHYIYFIPKEVRVKSAASSSGQIDVEVVPHGNVIFEFPRFKRIEQGPSAAAQIA